MFDSCPAYQNLMKLLYLAHTVPFPPNKGEKIRAFQQIRALSRAHEVHVACFARDEQDVESANELRNSCASVYAEVKPFRAALLQAAVRFLVGHSLNMAFYESRSMRAYVAELTARIQFDVTLAYALPMSPYAPPSTPVLLDMQDVDSQKWLEYAVMRRPTSFFRAEATRLQKQELDWASRVRCTYLTSRQEARLLCSLSPETRIECIENGVDFEYFNPDLTVPAFAPQHRRYIVFVGTMDYFPNIDGACWFAREIFPNVRRDDPSLEFLIVGSRPDKSVRKLGSLPGVSVTGGVPDVRPYVVGASAVVVPLRLARGIQNKVLESLAMGRQVFVTSAVCRTFGEELPEGVVECRSEAEFEVRIREALRSEINSDPQIRASASHRFTWTDNLRVLLDDLQVINSHAVALSALETEICPK